MNSATAAFTYTVNTDNFDNTFTMPDFTVSEVYCSFAYGLSEYTTDANSNSVRDDAEFAVVTATSESAGAYMFYKPLSTDTSFFINRQMPITNY